MESKLLQFITHARQKGMDHGTIRVLLLSAGWKEKDVAQGLAAEGLDLPVPEPPGSGGAREAFQYLTAFSALYTLVVNVILILFQFLDELLPDPAADGTSFWGDYRQNSIRWSIATLIVAAPLFFGFTRWIERDIRRHSDRSRSPIRRWLTYLTLFVAAITMMVDGTALIFGFLEGELTTRFLLKTLLVLALALAVFCYYLLSLRPYEGAQVAFLRKLDWSFGALAAAVLGLTITVGFLLVESPFAARLRKFDERRIADLVTIRAAIERQTVDRVPDEPVKRKLKRALPADLSAVDDFVRTVEHGRQLSLRDPQTGKPYEYAVKSETSYELCAEFSLPEEGAGFNAWRYSGGEPNAWNHPAGRYCFVIDVLKP